MELIYSEFGWHHQKTALADAEVEYQDHKSDTIYASFQVKSSDFKELAGCEILNNEDKITFNNNIDDCLFFES